MADSSPTTEAPTTQPTPNTVSKSRWDQAAEWFAAAFIGFFFGYWMSLFFFEAFPAAATVLFSVMTPVGTVCVAGAIGAALAVGISALVMFVQKKRAEQKAQQTPATPQAAPAPASDEDEEQKGLESFFQIFNTKEASTVTPEQTPATPPDATPQAGAAPASPSEEPAADDTGAAAEVAATDVRQPAEPTETATANIPETPQPEAATQPEEMSVASPAADATGAVEGTPEPALTPLVDQSFQSTTIRSDATQVQGHDQVTAQDVKQPSLPVAPDGHQEPPQFSLFSLAKAKAMNALGTSQPSFSGTNHEAAKALEPEERTTDRDQSVVEEMNALYEWLEKETDAATSGAYDLEDKTFVFSNDRNDESPEISDQAMGSMVADQVSRNAVGEGIQVVRSKNYIIMTDVSSTESTDQGNEMLSDVTPSDPVEGMRADHASEGTPRSALPESLKHDENVLVPVPAPAVPVLSPSVGQRVLEQSQGELSHAASASVAKISDPSSDASADSTKKKVSGYWLAQVMTRFRSNKKKNHASTASDANKPEVAPSGMADRRASKSKGAIASVDSVACFSVSDEITDAHEATDKKTTSQQKAEDSLALDRAKNFFLDLINDQSSKKSSLSKEKKEKILKEQAEIREGAQKIERQQQKAFAVIHRIEKDLNQIIAAQTEKSAQNEVEDKVLVPYGGSSSNGADGVISLSAWSYEDDRKGKTEEVQAQLFSAHLPSQLKGAVATQPKDNNTKSSLLDFPSDMSHP